MEKKEEIRKEGNEGEDAFISYLDKHDNVIEGWVNITSCNGFLIEFKTPYNLFKIPLSRVISIKERLVKREGK